MAVKGLGEDIANLVSGFHPYTYGTIIPLILSD